MSFGFKRDRNQRLREVDQSAHMLVRTYDDLDCVACVVRRDQRGVSIMYKTGRDVDVTNLLLDGADLLADIASKK